MKRSLMVLDADKIFDTLYIFSLISEIINAGEVSRTTSLIRS